jgi:hypothetical protein
MGNYKNTWIRKYIVRFVFDLIEKRHDAIIHPARTSDLRGVKSNWYSRPHRQAAQPSVNFQE